MGRVSDWNRTDQTRAVAKRKGTRVSKKLNLHPRQEMILDEDNVVRFRGNKIVRTLLDTGKFNLNDIAMMNFSQEDRIQFLQLIGYSVSGFGELSDVPIELARICDSEADAIYETGMREQGKGKKK